MGLAVFSVTIVGYESSVHDKKYLCRHVVMLRVDEKYIYFFVADSEVSIVARGWTLQQGGRS